MRLTEIPLEKRRKISEILATIGLLLICVSLISPFATLTNTAVLSIFKWVYAVGTLLYFAGRVIPVSDKRDSFRLRRMYRLEAWAGIAFVIAAAFWFYNDARFPAEITGALTILRQTIMFTMVGAMIQVITSWMITSRRKKEAGETEK